MIPNVCQRKKACGCCVAWPSYIMRHTSSRDLLSRDFGMALNVLNDMRDLKERRDARQASRRGVYAAAGFVLLVCKFWISVQAAQP